MNLFNKGWLCTNCGPIEKADNKKNAKHCPNCGSFVKEWERPLKERSGRCGNCGHGGFSQAMGKGQLKGRLLIKCKCCGRVSDPDTKEIFKEGENVK